MLYSYVNVTIMLSDLKYLQQKDAQYRALYITSVGGRLDTNQRDTLLSSEYSLYQ